MCDDRYEGTPRPDGEIKYDPIQRRLSYKHTSINELGKFTWVTQGDPTPRRHHYPDPPPVRIIERKCLACLSLFIMISESQCPGCGFMNSANGGVYR